MELTYGQLTSELLKECISDPTKVVALDLSGNGISPSYFCEIVDEYISRMVKLESLDLKSNRIGPSGATHLFDALRVNCPRLTYLDVNENAVHDEAMYPLALLLQCRGIRTLNVVTNHITPRGLPTLCDGVAACRSLTELSLAFNMLGNEGAKIVAELLRSHPSLTTLDLSDNSIGDSGAVALADAFILSNSSRVASLNLSVNRVGDVGFAAISEALAKSKNRHLHHLDLGCNSAVGEAGRAELVRTVPSMKYLQSLDLTSCNLSDADAQHLADFIGAGHTSLCTVEWYNNPNICLPTEKILHEAIEARSAAARRSQDNSNSAWALCAGVIATMAMVAVSVVLRHSKRIHEGGSRGI